MVVLWNTVKAFRIKEPEYITCNTVPGPLSSFNCQHPVKSRLTGVLRAPVCHHSAQGCIMIPTAATGKAFHYTDKAFYSTIFKLTLCFRIPLVKLDIHYL